MGVIVSQLIGSISIQGGSQAQADLLSMDANSKQAQASLDQLQNAAKDAGSILANRFSAELKNSQSGLQDLAVRADAAGLDVSKFASLQAQAAEASARLGVAQAQSAAAMEKANLVTADTTSSTEQVALAQSKAALSAELVQKAELNAGNAMAMVQGEATRLSDAMGASGAKGNLFASVLGGLKEGASGFFGALTEAPGKLMALTQEFGFAVFGVQMLTQAFVSVGDAAGKMIGDFQQQMTKLVTTAGESQGNLKMVGDGILAMAGPTATATKDLGDAMYWVESGGAHGAAGLADLKIAAEGAKAENANLTDVTKALMFTLNNYGDTGLTAAGAMNTLITAVGEGELTLQGLTTGISNVMPTAHAFGISLTDVAAGLATMSSQGDDAASAATHLAMMIKTIEAPATAGSKALTSIGLTTQQVTDEMRVSLPGALDMIVTALKTKFPEGSTAYNEAIKAISGGSRSMQAILETTGTHLDTFKQNVDKITGAVKAGGDSISGWDLVQQNFNFRMDQAKDAVGAFGIKMATALAPPVGQLIGLFTENLLPALSGFSDWFFSKGVPALQQFTAPLQTVGAWFQNFVGHGQASIPIFSAIGGVIAAILVPAVWSLASGVIAATWPFLAIGVAVGGLTAIFLHFYNTSADFRNFLTSTGVVLQQIGDFIAGTFTPVWQQLQDVWKSQLQPAIQELWASFKQLQPELTIVGEIIGGVLLVALGLFIGEIGSIIGSIAGMAHGIAEVFGGIVQIVSGYIQIFEGFVAFIVDLFTGHFDKLGGDLKVILGGIGQIFSGFGNVLKGIVDGIVGGITGGFKGAATTVIGYLNDLVHGVHDKTQDAADAANIHTLDMKIKTMKNSEEMSLGVIQNLDRMRMGIADELSRTTDVTKKQSLEIKLTQVTHAEDTAVKTWEAQKKSRQNTEGELDKLKTSSAQKHGDIIKDIQNIWGGIGNWFHGIWVGVENVFGGIGNWFHTIWQEAWGGVTSAWGAAGAWFEGIWRDIQGVFGAIGKWFSDRWSEVMNSTAPFRTYMGDVFQTIWNILVALWGKLGKWFQDRYNEVAQASDWLRNIIRGKIGDLWNDIVAKFSPIGKTFQGWYNDVANGSDWLRGVIRGKIGEIWNDIVAKFSALGKTFQGWWSDVASGSDWLRNYIRGKIGDAWKDVVTIFSPLGKWFQDQWTKVADGSDWLRNVIRGKFNDIKNDVSGIFKDMINLIIDQLNNGIGSIEGFINFFGQGLDSIATSLGTKGTIPVAHLGRIPHYAEGTEAHPGGLAVVGEKGRELVHLPPGSKVAPNDLTELFLSMTGGKIPGYAGGIGDLGSQILGWISGGAKTILDNVISTLHISAPNLGPMSNISSGIFDTLKNWALSWISGLLPKFTASAGGGTPVNVPGNVASWIEAAMALTHVPGNWLGPLETIAMKESGGNPNAINLTDSNAIAGHPSQGLFQTIPSTFAAHALSGHQNILNPIDNAASAIGYIIGRYGDVFHVPGIVSMSHGGGYIGYSGGGTILEPIVGKGLRTGTNYAFGEKGPETVVPGPYLPSGVNLASHANPTINITVNVAPNDLKIDSHRLATALMPAITNQIRYSVNVQGM